jgi:hypothetical protein
MKIIKLVSWNIWGVGIKFSHKHNHMTTYINKQEIYYFSRYMNKQEIYYFILEETDFLNVTTYRVTLLETNKFSKRKYTIL